ncbi:hypothetical protein, partial [Geobacillus stearothermophilus]|uniref:hypothetical protein n=1 Tax=Geobacillus stearothermophilus TaxID=1422 RepID=UPI001F3E71C2
RLYLTEIHLPLSLRLEVGDFFRKDVKIVRSQAGKKISFPFPSFLSIIPLLREILSLVYVFMNKGMGIVVKGKCVHFFRSAL